MSELNTVKDIHRRKELFVKTKLGTLSNEVDILQKDLLNLIVSDFVGKIKVDDAGNILQTSKNIALVNQLDQVFKDFNKNFHNIVLKKFGKDLLKLQVYNKDYYKSMDI